MFERDYLKRLIGQAAKAIGTVMGLKEQKKHEEALQHIDEFLGRELRLKTWMAMGLPDDDLLKMLTVGGVPNAEHVAIIAAFLQEEADLLADLDRILESVPRWAKALRLNLHLLREYGELEGWDVTARVQRLLNAMETYEWDEQTLRAVWQWREAEGRLDAAEDLLYELRELDAVSLQEGLDFYDRLEKLTDEALEAGGLSRSELREGKEQWVILVEETAK